MSFRARHCLFAALLALSVGVAATATAIAGASAPDVQTQAPTSVTGLSAVFHGLANPRTRMTSYWFEIGTTLAYGTTTNPASAGKGDKPVAVTTGTGGLQPATTYHVRLVASNDRGVTRGDDVTFTTSAAAGGAAAQPDATPLPAPAAPSPLPGTELAPAPTAPPVLERSVTLAPATGTVLVRVPGATNPAALGRGRLGAGRLDHRHAAGTVKLQSALPAGRTQTGTFHGGLFEVRQPAGGHGMTELVLRGALPSCPIRGRTRRRRDQPPAPAALAVGPRQPRPLPHAGEQQRHHRARHHLVRLGSLRRHA
jgi:hypothetical protein